MGAFVVRQVDRETGRQLARFAAPNVLAYEGAEYVYRQVFPPYQAAMSFQLGVAGPTLRSTEERPNEAPGFAPFGPTLTFAQCTDEYANEGGCYTDEMRNSFGYARQAAVFSAALVADGGQFVSEEHVFANAHEWAPQDGVDWDRPWTPEEVERPPPEWAPRESWEPVVAYPWQRPRKRHTTVCDPEDPDTCLYPYMHPWDPSGELDWLYDLRKMGGFPITLAFLIDSSRNKLVAAAQFRALVLLRPGAALHIKYQARICGKRVARDFAYRFVRYAFEHAGSRYDAIYCRPLLAEAPRPNRRTTYSDIEEYFHPDFGPVALANWTYVGGPPPRVESSNAPQWQNASGAPVGPFGWLAVYGTVGDTEELMWVTAIDPQVSVPNGDTLRVPDKVRFELEGV